MKVSLEKMHESVDEVGDFLVMRCIKDCKDQDILPKFGSYVLTCLHNILGIFVAKVIVSHNLDSEKFIGEVLESLQTKLPVLINENIEIEKNYQKLH
jgi:hypothetical protein